MTTRLKQDVLQGVWDGMRLFPFSLAAGVCSGFGLTGGFVTAVVCGVFGVVFGGAFFPTYLTLLPVYLLAFRFGAAGAGAAVLLGGVFTFFLSLLPAAARQRLSDPALRAGFFPAAAFAVTALETTNYFGIGAVGGTVRDILADYVSLGFHPNWRGVLYGTIALVLLITYPRKFKTLHKKISSAFVVLLIVLPLHLLLVPDAAHSPINEIGRPELFTLSDRLFLRGAFTPAAVPLVLCSALSLALLTAPSLPDDRSRALSAAQLSVGFFGGVPCTADDGRRSRCGALVCAVLAAALYFLPGLSRMPVHALAVILIVTAWQHVDWGAIRKAFSSGKRSILLFLCALLLPILADAHYAVPMLAALSAITIPNRKSSQS